jgi:indoleamine 2,3-dioxygenase
MFVVGRQNGFLPRKHPLTSLPKKFDVVDKILNDMRLIQADSSKGLLWDGKFGETVKRDLPLLDVSDITDPEL